MTDAERTKRLQAMAKAIKDIERTHERRIARLEKHLDMLEIFDRLEMLETAVCGNEQTFRAWKQANKSRGKVARKQ